MSPPQPDAAVSQSQIHRQAGGRKLTGSNDADAVFFWSLAVCLGSGESQTLAQTPTVSMRPGATARLNCDIGSKDDNRENWYMQTPGTIPQWILNDHDSWNSLNYAPGISSDRFTSTVNSAGTEYQLILNRVEMNDAAVYYCGKWATRTSTFGRGTKLFVTARQLPDPSVKLLGPSAEEISAKGAGTLVCLVSKLSIGFPVVSWTVNDSPTSSEVQTSGVTQNADKTFSLSSYLTVPGADWSSGKRYSCSVQQGAASTTSATVTQSSC
ncbi:immunoglobulin lambda-1 light chain-like [Mobula hypostoma]|uniref:immunoglobulin lambda-1 light chain-like n=1 Tax=Mobula hypostoma TaxID=723540 RepID=UPI002FC2CFA5